MNGKKIDNGDRAFAAFFTVMILVLGALIGSMVVAAFMAAPVVTVVCSVLLWFGFWKVYPRIIRAMERGDF